MVRNRFFTAFTLSIIILFSNNSPAAHSIQAAPPAQEVDPGQFEQVKKVLQSLNYTGSEPYVDWSPPECPNTHGLQTKTGRPGGIAPEQRAPGTESTHISVFLFPVESLECVFRHFWQEYNAMAGRFGSGAEIPWKPQRFTLKDGLDAAIQAFAWQHRQLSDGQKYPYGYTDGIFACGTVFFHVYGAKMGTFPVNEWDDWNTPARALAESQISRTKNNMDELASAMLVGNACYPESKPVPTPTHTLAAGQLGVGHGCSYNEPGISLGQVRCAATTTNALPNAKIEYAWKLDGFDQNEKGSAFSLEDKDISPGIHIIIVIARDTRNSKEASSSFSFTKPGGDMIVTVQCAIRAEDEHSAACYVDVKDAPAGASLAYKWTWDGVIEAETGRTLNKKDLKDGLYIVTVSASDSASGKSSQGSTTVQIGPPGQPAVNPPVQPPKPPDQPPGQSQAQECVASPGKDPYVEIVSMDGDVSARTGMGKWVECKLKQQLGSDVELHTGPESTVMLRFPDGATLEVKQLTQLMIGTLLTKKDRFKIMLLLQLGEAKASIPHREVVRSDFSIRTPTCVSSVRGTVATVRYDEETGKTTVSVEEGEVDVTPSNLFLLPIKLTAGQQAQITKTGVESSTGDISLVPGERLLVPVCGCAGLLGLVGILLAGGILVTRRHKQHK